MNPFRTRRSQVIPATPVALALAFLAGIALAAPAGAATLAVDTFVSEQTLQLEAGGADSTFGSVAAPEALGGERDARITRPASGDYADLLINPTGSDELASFSSSSLVTWELVWDGPDGAPTLAPDGLGGLDLTDGGTNQGFWIRVLTDVPATLELTVTGNGLGETTASLPLPGGDAGLVSRFLPFAAFDLPGLLADAGSVSLVLSGNAVDAQIDELTVPEPSAGAAAAGAALLALAAGRRRPARRNE